MAASNPAWKFALTGAVRLAWNFLYLTPFNTLAINVGAIALDLADGEILDTDDPNYQRFDKAVDIGWLAAWALYLWWWRRAYWYWLWVVPWLLFRILGNVLFVSITPEKRFLLAIFSNVGEPLSLTWQLWDWLYLTEVYPAVRSLGAKIAYTAVAVAFQVGKEVMHHVVDPTPAWLDAYVAAYYVIVLVIVPGVLLPLRPCDRSPGLRWTAPKLTSYADGDGGGDEGREFGQLA